MNTAREERLAYEIANTLDDMHSLKLHLSFAKRYSEKRLRNILNFVMNKPANKIETTRARYYTFLVQNENFNPGN